MSTVEDDSEIDFDDDIDDANLGGDDGADTNDATVVSADEDNEATEGSDRVRPKLIEPGSRQLRSTSRRRR